MIFYENNLEAHLTILIILEAQIQLVEAWGGGQTINEIIFYWNHDILHY